jgi:hypothetical protein
MSLIEAQKLSASIAKVGSNFVKWFLSDNKMVGREIQAFL